MTWESCLDDVETQFLSLMRAIDKTEFSFDDHNSGVTVSDPLTYPHAQLHFIRDRPDHENYTLNQRKLFYVLELTLDIDMDVESNSDLWNDHKVILGALVDMMDDYREYNPYWSILEYELERDMTEDGMGWYAGNYTVSLVFTVED